MKNLLRLTTVLLLLTAITAYAGGWATVTVRRMPEYFLVGKTAEFSFMVRQHGVTPLDGVVPEVEAMASNNRIVKGRVTSPGTRKGEFTAQMTFPEAGDWTIRIGSGWGPSAATLLPIKAITVGTAPPPPLTDVARGERLFVSKACITCHVNKEMAVANLLDAGPELTGRKFPEEYLWKLLENPASQGKDMPNQELTGTEIESLVAFINRKR